MTRTTTTAVLAGALLAVAPVSGASASDADLAPSGACDGQVSTVTTVVPGAETEIGGTGPVVNHSDNPSTTSYTVTSTKTFGGSVTGSATVSGDAGIAAVEASVGASFHYDVAKSTSLTTQMTVSPGGTGSVTLVRTPIRGVVQQYRLNPDCSRGTKVGDPATVHGSELKTVIA